VVYLLIETGMRRAAAVAADLDDVDWRRAGVTVREKGGQRHTYDTMLARHRRARSPARVSPR